MPGPPPIKPSLEAHVKRANEVGKTFADSFKDKKALGEALLPLFKDLEQHLPKDTGLIGVALGQRSVVKGRGARGQRARVMKLFGLSVLFCK